MTSSIFVWVYLPHQSLPVIAGRLNITKTAAGSVGRFVYGKSYLARNDAIPLDPVVLPINGGLHEFTALGGFPGAIVDSCPDRWGIKVIDRLVGKQEYPAGYLLMNDPGRAGNLAFSESEKSPPQELSSRQFSLDELLSAAESVEANRPVDPELLKALHPGTGGARPKCNIVDDEGVWIAKFPSINDSPLISIPRLEHATMRLGELCGIYPAKTKIQKVNGKDVCLVKRFDRHIENGTVFRKGFLSARSIFYADTAFQASGSGSYGRLARWLQRYGISDQRDQRSVLYRRMVFNVAIRNSDDHELNHGLVHSHGGNYELSPAYDVVPLTNQQHGVHHHALLIGNNAEGTVENLLSNATAFGLNRDQAYGIITEIESTIRNNAQEVFYEAGFDDNEIRRVERYFEPIPIESVSHDDELTP